MAKKQRSKNDQRADVKNKNNKEHKLDAKNREKQKASRFIAIDGSLSFDSLFRSELMNAVLKSYFPSYGIAKG